MQQHQIRPAKGSKRKRQRVGRGDAGRRGSYAGRGMKGQNARSGGGVRLGFEGGQLPLIKSLPMMRGFTNRFRKEYSVVNLDYLAHFPAGARVTPAVLAATGAVRKPDSLVKILGRGEIDVALEVEAHKFSASARAKIEAAGGSVREIA